MILSRYKSINGGFYENSDVIIQISPYFIKMSNRPLTRRAKAQAAAAIAATAQPATREIEPKPATKRKVIAGKRKAPTRKKAEPAS